MLAHISRIGIFMIAAQAMVHFAPGEQYEKYVKSVAGIMILFLFLKPFLTLFDVQMQVPQDVLERFEEWADLSDAVPEEAEDGAETEVVRRMEAEIKNLLNRDMEGEDYRVSSVSIRFVAEQESEPDKLLPVVQVWIAERGGEEEDGQILIDEIAIGREQEISSPEVFSTYRERFAGLLGIEEERVEVKQE